MNWGNSLIWSSCSLLCNYSADAWENHKSPMTDYQSKSFTHCSLSSFIQSHVTPQRKPDCEFSWVRGPNFASLTSVLRSVSCSSGIETLNGVGIVLAVEGTRLKADMFNNTVCLDQSDISKYWSWRKAGIAGSLGVYTYISSDVRVKQSKQGFCFGKPTITGPRSFSL